MLILLISALLLIFLLEAPRLLVAQKWTELAVFIGLWSLASFLAIAQFIGVELPNPTDLLNAVFSPK